MENFDIPNEQELQPDVVHNYDLISEEYPIADNNTVSTYNQFIQLRDTFIYSGKKYPGKAWAKLIVGEKEQTIEVQYKNRAKMSFQPDYRTNPERQINPWDESSPTASMTLQEEWGYVTWLWDFHLNQEDQAIAQLPQFVNDNMMAFKINKDGHYVMFHKEEILLQPNTKKVYCFLDWYKYTWDPTSPYPQTWTPIAVFDWEWQFSKTFSVSTSQWSGSCTVSFKLWDIFQKMTAFGYNERNLNKKDVLVLKCIDNEKNQNPNELVYQTHSNFVQINYTDLPLKY